MAWILFTNGLISLIDCLILLYFVRLFLPKRVGKRYLLRLIFACCAIVFIHMMFFQLVENANKSPYKLPFFMATDILAVALLFRDKLRRYALFVGLNYVRAAIVEGIVTSLLTFIFRTNVFDQTSSYDGWVIGMILLMRVVEFLLIRLMMILKNRPIHKTHWIGLILLPVVTVVFGWLVYPRFWALDNPDINALLTVFAVYLVVQNILVFTYVATVQSSTERYLEMKDAYDRQQQYFTTFQTVQRAVRKMAHDIRNHFIVLMSTLEQGNVDGAKDYLVELDGRLENLTPVNVTGNYEVDAILHAKIKAASQAGVKLQVRGELPASLKISLVDLSALIGNSVDNAIEACKAVEQYAREVQIEFTYRLTYLSYRISNPYAGVLRQRGDGYFVSSKDGGGLGIEIMDQISKKYGGTLSTRYGDNFFSLCVNLPNTDERFAG